MSLLLYPLPNGSTGDIISNEKGSIWMLLQPMSKPQFVTRRM